MSRIGHTQRIETLRVWLNERKKNGYVIKTSTPTNSNNDLMNSHILSTKLRKR